MYKVMLLQSFGDILDLFKKVVNDERNRENSENSATRTKQAAGGRSGLDTGATADSNTSGILLL
jgi:hypothetical protein